MKRPAFISFIFVLQFFCSAIGGFLFAQEELHLPVANFETDVICYGSTTNFTNTSTSPAVPGYTWTIYQKTVGPIYTSTNINISFQFPVKTTYTVELSLLYFITPTHFHGDYVQRVVDIDSVPTANFDFRDCHAKFANTSNCCSVYQWDFGDGQTSTQKAPHHIYTIPQAYTVTLIAGNGTIYDTSKRVINPIVDIMTGNFNITVDGDTMRFSSTDDTLRGEFCDWEWDMGDGTDFDIFGKEGMKVKHKFERYEKDSTYTIVCAVADACFSHETEQKIVIKGTGITGTKVFPNPLEGDYLSVESERNGELLEINVYDCLGQTLGNRIYPFKYGHYVDFSSLAKGVYFVNLVFPEKTMMYKILKP